MSDLSPDEICKLPPDYESPYTSTGLVKILSDIMFAGVPTHPDWPETLACSLIGMIMGKGRYTDNILGNLYANILSIMVGPSGLSFKTVPLKKLMRPVINELSNIRNDEICRTEYGFGTNIPDVHEDMTPAEIDLISDYPGLADFNDKKIIHRDTRLKGMSREEKATWVDEGKLLKAVDRRLVDYLQLERFTTEILTTHLVNKPQGLVVGDEFTKTFKGTKNRDYLSDNMEDISRLADCDMGKVGTQSRGIEYAEHAYVGLVSATTIYLLDLMDEKFFQQGTGNRCLWIFDTLDTKSVRTPDELEAEALSGKFFWEINDEEEHKKVIKKLARLLYNIRHLPKGLVLWDLHASIDMDRYRLKRYNDALRLAKIDIKNIDANVMVRLAQNAMRLAMIHCVGRYAEGYDPTEPLETQMTILPEDVKWGMAKMERHFTHYINMMKFKKSLGSDGEVRSYEKDIERIMGIYDRSRDERQAMTDNYIAIHTGWSSKDIKTVLNIAQAQGLIQFITTKKRGFAHQNRDWNKEGNRVSHYIKPEHYGDWKDIILDAIKPRCGLCGEEIDGIPNIQGTRILCEKCWSERLIP